MALDLKLSEDCYFTFEMQLTFPSKHKSLLKDVSDAKRVLQANSIE